MEVRGRVQHVESQMSKMHVFKKLGSFFHRFFNITLGELKKKIVLGHLMVFISLFLRHPTEPF